MKQNRNRTFAPPRNSGEKEKKEIGKESYLLSKEMSPEYVGSSNKTDTEYPRNYLCHMFINPPRAKITTNIGKRNQKRVSVVVGP